MGPDLTWVAIVSVGGLAMGLVTSLIGLRKGQEFTGWMFVYAVTVTAVVLARAPAPFWTVLVGSITMNLAAGTIQVGFLPTYRRRNPWADHVNGPPGAAAGGLIGFALFAGCLFGIIAASAAWALSLV